MEFDFAVAGLHGDGITVWDAGALAHLNSVEFHKFRNVLEVFGERSAKAQGLRASITDIWRVRSSDQRLYLQTAAGSSKATRLLGGLKVGRKKLFIHRASGVIAEIEPLCVLDFYVHESCQRQGVGKTIFEYMLEAEGTTADQVAYDRPSPKLLAFLHKHYGLANYVPQNNNFVVFEQYFQQNPASPAGTRKLNRPLSSNCISGSTMTYGSMAALGNGRQNVHVLGSAAAAGVENTANGSWVPTSLRPPTASLQHGLQLQPAASVAADGSNWQGTATTALTSTLGGPGLAAGIPTNKQPSKYGTLYSDKATPRDVTAQPSQTGPMSYARGAGYKALDRGAAGTEPNTFKGYSQTLMGAAVNPAPAAGLGTVRDSLDQFSSIYGIGGNTSTSNASSSSPYYQQQGSTSYGSRQQDYGYPQQQDGCCSRGSRGGAGTGPADKYPMTPYGNWEPQPGTLAASSGADHVSLRRQQEEQQEQRRMQQMAKWEVAGAAPPGQLLAAPTAGYAVPTEGMAELLGRSQQQQAGSVAPSSNIISWDGLPVPGVNRVQQQQQQGSMQFGQQQPCPPYGDGRQRYDTGIGAGSQQYQYGQYGQQPGELSRGDYGSRSSRAGSTGGMGQGGLDYGNAKSAAAVFRAGAGAASCLRMY